MKSRARFAKGSGCYNCAECGKRTRSTGRGDNENVGLCADCYDRAGIENHHSDQGHAGSAAECVECRSLFSEHARCFGPMPAKEVQS